MGQPSLDHIPLSSMSQEDQQKAIAAMDCSETAVQDNSRFLRRRPIPIRQVLPAGRKLPSGAPCPILVYGFPISYAYGYIFAVRHNIAPHKNSELKRGVAGVKEILKRLRAPVFIVDYAWSVDEEWRMPSHFICLGSNASERQWKAALSRRERIEEIQRVLETKDEPQWLSRRSDSS